MKLIALAAAAFALSGAAVAQTAPTTQTAPAANDPAQPVTTITTDPSMTPSTVVNVAVPGNYTSPPPADPPSSYPPCSRTVTDHCRQLRDPK